MCFSSQGTTNSVSEFKPPSYTQQPWQDMVAAGGDLAKQGLPQYQGMTVAPRNFQQQTAADMGYNLATAGSPVYNAGAKSLTDMLGGGTSNPYAAQANKYAGPNPYLEGAIDASNQGIIRNYQKTVSPQLDAAAAMHGAYGGSAYGQQLQDNQQTLANSLAKNENDMRMQQYGMSAGLEDARLGRASQGYSTSVQQMLAAAGLAPTYEATDWNAIQNLQAQGDANRGYQQQLLDQGQKQFGDYVTAPWQSLDLYRAILQAASGQGGSSTSSIVGGQYSPISTIGGLGASLYGLLGGGK